MLLINKSGKNKMIFQLIDNTNLNLYNESIKMEKIWYGNEEDGQVMSIETFYTMCKEFAKGMGFAEKTVEEWFGEY